VVEQPITTWQSQRRWQGMNVQSVLSASLLN